MKTAEMFVDVQVAGEEYMTAWLSCSHAFHANCIKAFEAHEADRGLQPLCPCCRNPYACHILQ